MESLLPPSSDYGVEQLALAGWSQPIRCPKDVTVITGNTVLINSGCHAREDFSANYPQFGRSLRKVHRTCPRSKNFQEYRVCRGSKLSACPIHQHVSGRTYLPLPGYESRTIQSLLRLRKVEVLRNQWRSVALSGFRRLHTSRRRWYRILSILVLASRLHCYCSVDSTFQHWELDLQASLQTSGLLGRASASNRLVLDQRDALTPRLSWSSIRVLCVQSKSSEM